MLDYFLSTANLILILFFLLWLLIILTSLLFSFIYSYVKMKKLFKKDNNSDKVSNEKTTKSIKNILNSFLYSNQLMCVIYVGKIKSQYLRLFVYKKVFLINIEPKVIIYRNAEIRDPHKLKIGKGSIIGNDAILDARNSIEIGENVNLSTGVWLWSEQHDYQSKDFALDVKKKGIKIGDRAWLGPRTIILPDITIGEGAVVAGGAVVTKDVEAFTVVGGIPAKVIGQRNKNIDYIFNGEHLFFI